MNEILSKIMAAEQSFTQIAEDLVVSFELTPWDQNEDLYIFTIVDPSNSSGCQLIIRKENGEYKEIKFTIMYVCVNKLLQIFPGMTYLSDSLHRGSTPSTPEKSEEYLGEWISKADAVVVRRYNLLKSVAEKVLKSKAHFSDLRRAVNS